MPKQIEDRLDACEYSRRMEDILETSLTVFRSSFSSFGDRQVQDAAMKCERQIIATKELLGVLSCAPPEQVIAADVYLERLGYALFGAVLGPMNVKLELSVDAARLPVDVCKRLGLIVVELVMNASKSAFRGQRSGVVRVELFRSGRTWCCQVSDNGAGASRSDRDAGPNLVEALVRSLNGYLINCPEDTGASVYIYLPDYTAPHRVAAEHDAIIDAARVDGYAQAVH